MIAVIAGSTGLIGSHLLKILEDTPEFTRIITMGRKAPDAESSPKRSDAVVDLSVQSRIEDCIENNACVFICLGTTIKKAGSQNAFRVVDYEYPLNIVRASAEKKAKSVHLVTALGADASSSIFYNRVKGETEAEAEKVLENSNTALTIYRPSLLLGKRSEFRPGESMAAVTSVLAAPLLSIGPLRGYKPVRAGKVARAMVANALKEQTGIQVIESKSIQNY